MKENVSTLWGGMNHEIQIMKLVCWYVLAPLCLCLHSADWYTFKLTRSLTSVKNVSSFLTLRGTVSAELRSKEKLCVVGAVERVKKIRDYAFVHFTHREDAINAMNTLNGKVSSWTLSSYRHKMDNRNLWCGFGDHVRSNHFSSVQVVDGSPIEVTLAKPVDKDSYIRYTRGTGGRGGSLLQTDYAAYTLGQVS